MSNLLKKTGRWWLIPAASVLIVLALAAAGLLLSEQVAPFIYEVF